MVKQYDVYWVDLAPTQGGEIAKARPCVIVSPASLNNHMKTVIIAPITSTIRNVSFRVGCSIAGRDGEIAADQIRTVDKKRLKKAIGTLSSHEIAELQQILHQMFCL